MERTGCLLYTSKYHADFPDRCIGFSEYGADANPQYQSSHPEKGDYTESYQCVYHEHIAKMIAERPWLWATHVWNMFDFAADGRDEGGKQMCIRDRHYTAILVAVKATQEAHYAQKLSCHRHWCIQRAAHCRMDGERRSPHRGSVSVPQQRPTRSEEHTSELQSQR